MSDAAQQQQAECNLASAEPPPDDGRLNGLPLELQLHIANAVGERCDRAALALASPRPLGLAACRQLPSYQGLEMSLLVGGAIDEKALRWYASRAESTPEGCKWLAGVAAAAGLPKCKIIVWPPRVLALDGKAATGLHGIIVWPMGVAMARPWENEQRWFLMQPGSTFGALLRLRRGEPQAVYHYKGEEGAERLVRLELPSGELQHLEGEKGTELLVRRELPGGMVQHYEGEEMGAERLVRLEVPCGMVQHYEGERGVERLVRRELLCGTVENFEGEQRAERLVCIIQPIGGSLHYDYESGAQRLVRIELPFGGVIHFDGETGGE